jgi:hypothetical protein
MRSVSDLVAALIPACIALAASGCTTARSNVSAPAPPGTAESPRGAPVAPEATRKPPPGSADQMFHVFLLLGQSNMWGVPEPDERDRAAHPRVKVLAYEDCPALGREYNHWYPASPPLHACKGGVGPGDGFGRTYADARPGVTVGLVPLAIGGAGIALFRKGVVADNRSEFRIPPDDHLAGGYEWILERARIARGSGVISGILLHQGESDAHFNTRWEFQVRDLVADLRRDLELGDGAPFVAGELLRTGCCGSFNSHVQALPGLVPNAAVVSSEGLTGLDPWHFDLKSQRLLGERYATFMLGLARR